MNKIKALAVAVGLMGGSIFLLGTQQEQAEANKPAEGIISEIHTITKVTPTEIYGESTYFGGEGIYYTKDIINQFTDEEIEVGDRVEIQWKESAVSEEDWFSVYSFRVLD